MVMRKIEDTLGLPPLKESVELLNKIPDEKKLKTVKDILLVAERVSHTMEDLDKVVSLIKEINEMPIEKLDKLEKVLKRMEKVIKSAPDEIIQFVMSLKDG